MIAPVSRISAVCVLVVALAAAAADPPAKLPASDPITNYEAHRRQGFNVMLSRRLPAGGPMILCLDERLAEIARAVPPAQLSLLRGVTFWVEAGSVSEPWAKSRDAAACYVPLEGDYQTAYGIRREKQGGIVILTEALLIEPWASWSRECWPGWLLHEVAHALEDRVAGPGHPAAQAAYRQAMDRKLYDAVDSRECQADGRLVTKRGPAYARTNHREYFAELSAAYLGLPTGFFPFTREELRRHDTAGYELMEKFWRSTPTTVVNAFPVPVSVDRVAETGRRFRLFDLLPGKERQFDGWEGMALIATDQLDGTEYRFGKPNREGRSWRLSPPATGGSATAVTPPAPTPPR
jgi:hypothetical protein